MPKLWTILEAEDKTRLMALRHYLAKRENNKGGKKVKSDKARIIIEEQDINKYILSGVLRDYQFNNHNELPKEIIMLCPASATGKDRNNRDYDIPFKVIQAKPKEEPEPVLPGRVKMTPEPDVSPKEADVAEIIGASDLYFCEKCQAKHKITSKIGKRHQQFSR